MESHVKLLGWLYVIFSILGVITAAFVFVAVAGGGWISGDADAIRITSIVATAVAAFLVLLSVPGFIVGLGLLKFKPWARVLALVLGILNLPGFPIGTALGIYSIWVLLNDESSRLFTAPA
jgi:hypothetical protein